MMVGYEKGRKGHKKEHFWLITVWQGWFLKKKRSYRRVELWLGGECFLLGFPKALKTCTDFNGLTFFFKCLFTN